MGVYWAKPTLEDIAAQRAMLERGEEKRKAAKQAEERDRLRDTFAAAALAGFVAGGIRDADDYDRQLICRDAYRWADAMLRERGQSDRSQPVRTPACQDSSQKNCTLTAEDTPTTHTTSDAQEPVAWAVENASVATGLAWLIKREAVDFSFQHGGRIVPLYSHPQPTLTAEEREAVEWCRDNIIPMSSSASAFAFIHTATLRNLLERTK